VHLQIFEKGTQAIPLSVDLWIHYLNYAKDAFAKDEQRIRDLFEKSLKACGLEFRYRLFSFDVKKCALLGRMKC
jgi:5-methylcytosine-specific restriction endonuclease McrBC GTP-binding regulatory subunit McrB